MNEELIHERYRELACAAIAQGVNDWLRVETSTEYGLYKWIQETDYFDYLGIDRDYFYVKVLKLREKKVRSINLSRYGKKDEL